MRFSLTQSTVFAFTAGVLFFASGRAAAQEACGESTCPKGYICESTSGGCPAIACLEGSDCAPGTPTEVQVCVPGPCTTDADCDAGMACATIESMSCPTAPACDPAAECPQPVEPVQCTPTVSHECRPRWQLPCTVAADCGEGFTCEQVESCGCSGGSATVQPSSGSGTASSSGTAGAAPSAGAAGAAPIAPPPDTCECQLTGELACKVIQAPCTTDSDCVVGFSCQDNPNGACWADTQGNTGCTPADPPRLCVPPYADLGGGGFATGESGSTVTTGGDNGATTETPRAPAADTAGDTPAASEAAASGGCSVNGAPGTPASSGMWWLVVAAMLGLRRRRTG